MAAKQLQELRLEVLAPVMLLLRGDVLLHPRQGRLAHRKSAVPFLPGEMPELGKGFVDPLRRPALDLLEQFRMGQVRSIANQQMNMVGRAVDRQ